MNLLLLYIFSQVGLALWFLKIMSKSPAFQFYPSDWLSDFNVQLMTLEQKGSYIDLLCHDWKNDGIPSSAIAQLSGLKDKWEDEENSILRSCFMAHPCDSHKLTNKRLLKERQKQEKFREERSISGKKGASSRWNKKTKKSNGSAIKEPMAKNGSSSSSSSSDIKRTFKKPTVKEVEVYSKSIEFNLNGNDFIDHYESKGWLIGKNKMKDWKACVRTWKNRNAKEGPEPERYRERTPEEQKVIDDRNARMEKEFDERLKKSREQ